MHFFCWILYCMVLSDFSSGLEVVPEPDNSLKGKKIQKGMQYTIIFTSLTLQKHAMYRDC